MTKRYLGHLGCSDPLDGYLRFDIAPQLAVRGTPAGFRVFKFDYSRDVYLYEEIGGAFRVVGKFFPPSRRWASGLVRPPTETEFRNLSHLHQQGLNGSPFRIARPLGYNPWLHNLLIVEHFEGQLLGDVIDQAIRQNRSDRLFRKLSAVAEFLALLHNRTAGDWTVDFMDSYEYAGRLVESLVQKRGIARSEAEELYHLRENWRSRTFMWEDRRVIVHGDATPSNIKIGPGRQVMIFDLERMKWADRVFDLGRLSGELKHSFMQATGDRWAAEPFIGHFLWEYCGHFPNRSDAFRSVTRRLPFYLGITLLRIARNSWIDWNYRLQLLEEAKENLRAAT
ncbi:MAG: aminoglycoside phosphotransferase family protein [Syntrophaceae bacterium]|nr:aminoglycoside phosphotransferase family protein [Syntrophaceae bacterium]